MVDVGTETLRTSSNKECTPIIMVATANAFQPLVTNRLKMLGLTNVIVSSALPSVTDAVGRRSCGYRVLSLKENRFERLVAQINTDISKSLKFFQEKVKQNVYYCVIANIIYLNNRKTMK